MRRETQANLQQQFYYRGFSSNDGIMKRNEVKGFRWLDNSTLMTCLVLLDWVALFPLSTEIQLFPLAVQL